MYDRILVPIDGSLAATSGLEEAIKLAKVQGSRLYLVHVVDELFTISPEVYGAVYDQMTEQSRESGRAILATAETLARNAGVTFESQLVETLGGPVGEYVVKAANTWKADLIVCGTHGRRGLRRIVLGSDAEYIVRHTTVPVLLIRHADTNT